jgi:myosin heavy subunit
MAYRALMSEGRSQSVVISGESGAGKTKSAREILRYIVEVASGAYDVGGNGVAEADVIVRKITMNNPILEAFGNAKTLRNDNSSRFGKYLELCFGLGGGLEGARIQTYLLEKSRLIHQTIGERNFHVFYMLLEGLANDEYACKELRLRRKEEYRYLGGAQGTFVADSAYEDELGEAEQWRVLDDALGEMGVQV